MAEEKTVRVSLRLKAVVHEKIVEAAADAEIEPATYMQQVLMNHIKDKLPPLLRKQMDEEQWLLDQAQRVAQEVDGKGEFDSHFTLTVIKRMMQDPEIKGRYEALIGADANARGVPGKSPLNMYLGYFIKNAIDATPILGPDGKPRRAFVRNQPIQSYTLLQRK